MIPKRYDTFWPRFIAAWIDSAVLAPLGAVDSFIWKHQHLTLSSYLVVWYFISLAAPLGYTVVLHWKYGQTIGKRLCGVIVIDADEKHVLSLRRALLRDSVPIALSAAAFALSVPFILGILSNPSVGVARTIQILGYSCFAWFAMEIVTMAGNQKRRALHDHIGGTVVVNRKYVYDRLRSPEESERGKNRPEKK